MSVGAIRYVEGVCKSEGFNVSTYNKCWDYIIRNVIGNANNRGVMFGMHILEYLDKQKSVLIDCCRNDNISFDIIESDFGPSRRKVTQQTVWYYSLYLVSAAILKVNKR